eukprot:1853965-Amphidinium_carterae.1
MQWPSSDPSWGPLGFVFGWEGLDMFVQGMCDSCYDNYEKHCTLCEEFLDVNQVPSKRQDIQFMATQPAKPRLLLPRQSQQVEANC